MLHQLLVKRLLMVYIKMDIQKVHNNQRNKKNHGKMSRNFWSWKTVCLIAIIINCSDYVE